MKTTRWIILAFAIVLFFAVVFQIGVEVGVRKSSLIEPHGLIGRVLKNEPPYLVVEGRDRVQRSVFVSDRTDVRRFHDPWSADRIRPDERVLVIGDPDELGSIQAKFIRVFPLEFPRPPFHR